MVKKYLTTLLLAGCSAANPETGGAPDLAFTRMQTSDLAVAFDLAAASDSAKTPSSGPADYGSDGADGVDKFSVTARTNLTLTIYAPTSAGPHPVVLLASGLQQPAAAYAPYAQRLASWGMVTLLRDDPGVFSASTDVAADVSFVVGTWLAAQNSDSGSKLFGRLDVAHVGLAGHSRGGQATLLAAEGDSKGKVVAWFGIDPVDSKPMGAGTAPQARTNLGTLGIPTAFLGETTDGSGGMACAPSSDNFQALYAAAPAPSVQLTALGADHTQFEDPTSCSFCTLCTKGTADSATVLAYSVRYLTAFFARELKGDSTVGAAFDGAGAAADVSANRLQISAK